MFTSLPLLKRLTFIKIFALFAMTNIFAQAPAITSPAPGTTLTGSIANFEWSAGAGTITSYELVIGTDVGFRDLYQSGVSGDLTASASVPTDGSTLYVRLWYFDSDPAVNAWLNVNYTYTAANVTGKAELTSPTPSTDLSDAFTGTTVTFEWNVGNATEFDVIVGSNGPGSNDLRASSILPLSTTSLELTNLPTDGSIINFRLWSNVNGTTWAFTDYQFRAQFTQPEIISPVVGSEITNATTTFNWSAGSATRYDLIVGTTGVGSNDIQGSSIIDAPTTSVDITGLPTDGTTLIYVRLWSLIGGSWTSQDYLFNDPTVLSVTDITDNSIDRSVAYPVPVTRGNNISFRFSETTTSVNIFNTLGQQVGALSEGVNDNSGTTFTFKETSLDRGYYYAVSSEGKTLKFTIQ
ncbi:hypothetical protein [Aquimarina sp. 2201CG5-10]|uniref:hypothetical protein n=1 Tax=Aquimarina callyspongiae TaxID=3098150 RepID=UPI002AB36697|nr:hypothetical protein [Aquimarina sp. 2201CG5-10]MDY8135522.1 hypothetical protein [Aquimarina sp. 2201CG5-10]